MPDVATLFQQILDNEEQLEGRGTISIYPRTESEVESEGQGGPGAPARTFEVFSVRGRRVEKLVAKEGRPLTPDEAHKEEKRIDKLIREQGGAKDAPQRPASRDDDELTVRSCCASASS